MLGPLVKNGSGEFYSNNFESEATRAFLRRHDASRLQSQVLSFGADDQQPWQ